MKPNVAPLALFLFIFIVAPQKVAAGTPASQLSIDAESSQQLDEYVSRGSRRSHRSETCTGFLDESTSSGESTRGFVDYDSSDGSDRGSEP